jgi:hypothetical protein
MDETSKTFIKWEKFLRKNPNFTGSEADPKICAQLLANQEEFEKETILDIAKKNFKKKRKKKK